MSTTDPSLAHLAPAQRQAVAAWLGEFDRSWGENRLAAQIPRLPPVGDPLRQLLLLALVKVDLAKQWQRGRRISLELYLKSYPELGTAETVSVELIRAEYEIRTQHGALQDLSHFPRRRDPFA